MASIVICKNCILVFCIMCLTLSKYCAKQSAKWQFLSPLGKKGVRPNNHSFLLAAGGKSAAVLPEQVRRVCASVR